MKQAKLVTTAWKRVLIGDKSIIIIIKNKKGEKYGSQLDWRQILNFKAKT